MSAVAVDDDRLLLVRRGRGRAQGTWALPGGRVQPAETLAEAVVREMVEETALEAVCGPLVGINEMVGPDGPHQVVLVFWVRLLEWAEPTAGDDAAEARWVRLDDVAEMVLAPGVAEFLHDHAVIATIT